MSDPLLQQLTGPGGPFEIVEQDVLGERMPVFKSRQPSLRALLEGARAHGDKEHIVYQDRRIRFSEFVDLVGSTAAGLSERYGIGRGDRVAILAANRPEWLLTFWASVSLGAIVSALNGWWTRDEILYGVEHSEPTLLVGDARRLERVAGDDLGGRIVDMDADFAALEGHAPGAALPDTPIAEDDPAVILYTSGTTGRPTGAVASHRGICGFVQGQMLNGLRRALANPPDPNAPAPTAMPPLCALVTVPLFHMSGLYSMAVMMLAVGSKCVYRAGRFDPEDVLRLIEQEKVTTWSALGSMGPRVLDYEGFDRFDVSSVRNIGFGGAPTSPALQERVRKAFPNSPEHLGLGYGSSETVAVVATIGGRELIEHPESVGPPSPTIQVEIRDDEGKALPEGQDGEICVRSAYNMLEYWRDPENTAKTLLPGRWLATGDVGHMQDGRLYINTRARDLILRAAENVSPVEIEHRLDAHPSVGESAVIGVDHPDLGQEVKAIVVPAPGERIDVDALRAWCAETLAGYKVPSLWEVRDEPLPRNAAGKVLKTVLKGEAEHRALEE